jgi:hypothetical protein
LQVQAANQKLLHAELQSLLETISISSEELGPLREASIESNRGIQNIEESLVRLYKAMLTIDPSLGVSSSRPSEDGSLGSTRPGGYGNSEIGSMRVLQEKKDVYKGEITLFLRRLKPFLQIKFAAAIDETSKAMEQEKKGNLSRAAGRAKLDSRNFDLARNILWKYSPLMLFAREVDRLEWEELLKMYEAACRPMYQNQFREVVFAWKRIVRKPIGDESDILFTSQVEKQTEGIATTARKLTVKRSQTLAKSLRSPIGDSTGKSSQDKVDGRLQPYDIFAGLLDETIPIIIMEQNFLVEFFHISSLEQHDFPDAVNAASPDLRRGSDLKRTRVMDPNRDLAKLVVNSMEEIYSSYAPDMQGLVEWTLQADPLYVSTTIPYIPRKTNVHLGRAWVSLQQLNDGLLASRKPVRNSLPGPCRNCMLNWLGSSLNFLMSKYERLRTRKSRSRSEKVSSLSYVFSHHFLWHLRLCFRQQGILRSARL